MRQLSAKRSPLLLKTQIQPSWWLRLNLYSSENRTQAHCCCPQQKCCCAHCKPAARWRAVSTCPTCLLGWMGCWACLRRRNTVCLLIPYCLEELITVWKRRRRCVSVMNLSVRRFVTLSLLGLRQSATPPVCWKRLRNPIIVFLWQPNALLTLEMSPRASIVKAWIRWFWFSLGMFSDKRFEIKCVFSLCSGYEDYVYSHFLWHVPSPRTACANQALSCISIYEGHFLSS